MYLFLAPEIALGWLLPARGGVHLEEVMVSGVLLLIGSFRGTA